MTDEMSSITSGFTKILGAMGIFGIVIIVVIILLIAAIFHIEKNSYKTVEELKKLNQSINEMKAQQYNETLRNVKPQNTSTQDLTTQPIPPFENDYK